jgi:transposase
MSGFIQGEDRNQSTLFPERLDDYVAEDSAVRVIDVFIDELDLSGLGFKTQPNDTGRPAYHPATMLKLFVYGYLNRVHSSRRLEREAQRNVELMWLTGRLAPDFKTIADFRKDNGTPIRLVCRQFVILCRNLNLFANAFVAIDGSKFKAVNNRDRNFTRAKMKRRIAEVDATIDRYLQLLAEADRQEPAEDKTQRLEDKITALKQEMARLKKVEARMLKAPGQQISLTDPDARSMNHRGSGVVGYNVQTAVDTEHHLIVAHEVTNVGSDRRQLTRMSEQAKTALAVDEISVVADRGYYRNLELKACEEAGITTYVPNSSTSPNKAQGKFDRSVFRYVRMPGGAALGLAHDQRGEGYDAASLLVRSVRGLCAQSAMYDRKTSAHDTLGARGGGRPGPDPVGAEYGHDAATPGYGRASVRNTKGVDGIDPLLDQNPRSGEY